MSDRLKILLANSEMEYPGGTQSWVRQMYRTLSIDHEVAVFAAEGALPVDLCPFDPSTTYDLGIINHWTATQALRKAKIEFRIVTCHGVLPYEEIPVLGADRYVAVSESVRDKIPFASSVIRNPIDLAHFRPLSAPSTTLKRLAFVSNRQGDARPLIEAAAGELGVELRIVGKENAVSDPLDVYNWADMVIGIARVAMEALACGRNVLAMDYLGNHGLASPQGMAQLRSSNYGGHARGTWPTVRELADQIAAYDPDLSLRDEIENHHDPTRVATQYLDLHASSRPSRVARLLRNGPRQVSSPKISQVLSLMKRRSLH